MGDGNPGAGRDVELQRPGNKRTLVLGAVGIAVGGVVGALIFYAFAKRAILLWALPGAFVGLGRVVFVQRRSWPLAVACAVAGLAVPLVIAHAIVLGGLPALSARTVFTIAVGGLIAFWFGLGRSTRR